MIQVKICGITSREDYDLAAEAGADIAGFIFIPGTLRYISPASAREIILGAGRTIKNAGLFMNADLAEVRDIVTRCGLDLVQLQGQESPEEVKLLRDSLCENVKVIKAFKVADGVMSFSGKMPDDYLAADMFVFDTYHPGLAGGTGERFAPAALKGITGPLKKPFFIAGGLKPGNVARLVRTVAPYGVDTSSGVESDPGRKDERKVREFVENAKEKNA